MKTPMQELIEEYQRLREDGDNDMRTVIYLAEEMLEKEKEVIVNAYETGDKYKTEIPGEQYYNETFNTKEK
jgi:hypothetical protein